MKIGLNYAVLVLILVAFSPLNSATQERNETIGDENIKPVDFEELRYPIGARSLHVEGVVVVKVILDGDGGVVQATAMSGAKSLIPECLSNAKKWRFRPNSQKAAVIVYEFRIDPGLCHGGLGSDFIFRPPNLASITSCEAVAEF